MNVLLTGLIVLASLAGILFRPFGVREAVPSVLGATALVACGLMPIRGALAAAWSGEDVYLFLAGMMLLAELALVTGVFDWAAGHLGRFAAGSPMRLFCLVYALAVLITAFLSNDATAVVFTPAVAALAAATGAPTALPYLLICAFVANAASFLLPISNPANLVLFGRHLPRLEGWVGLFGGASLLALLATFVLLWMTQRKALAGRLRQPETVTPLSAEGWATLAGLGAMSALLLLASARGWPLGQPAFFSGLGCTVLVCGRQRGRLHAIFGGVAWSVLPLVAGLFVMVGALDQAGFSQWAAPWARAGLGPVGIGLAVLCNLANNLPVGLLAAHLYGNAPPRLQAAALIGVDLGPNLSVAGSLATILWLNALRREGIDMTAGKFLRLGVLVMPTSLVLALLGLWLT